jgi:hypothetical protein
MSMEYPSRPETRQPYRRLSEHLGLIYWIHISISVFHSQIQVRVAHETPCIILLKLKLNYEQGVISDRLVVRNIEQVCCYYISGNAFSKSTNNMVNMLSVKYRCLGVREVSGGACMFFSV